MFLEYLALGMILVVLIAVFYTFIYIHDIPYDIAKHRNHPHKEAIHVATWLSLFTLHAIWPIVFIWAVSHPDPAKSAEEAPPNPDMGHRLGQLETRLGELEIQMTRLASTSGRS